METKRENSTSEFMVPVFVMVALILLNVFFWNDYQVKKQKTADVQKEKKELLSVSEGQRNELERVKTNLSRFQADNATLVADLSSTTDMLASVEIELLKQNNDLSWYASTTELEIARNAKLLESLKPSKK